MSLRYQDLVLRDFSGGISDNYVGMPQNRCEIGDNVFILEDRSFETRYGSIPVYDREIPTKINHIDFLDDDAICVRDSLVWLFNGGTLAQPIRPQSGSPIWQNTLGFNTISTDQWQDQMIITHSGSENTDDLNYPMRVYRDDSNVLRISQLGLTPVSDSGLESISFKRGDERPFEYYEPDRSLPPPYSADEYNHSYIYAFIYSYEFTTGRSTYRVVSPVQITSILYTNQPLAGTPQTGLITADTVKIRNLPVFNVTNTQYDFANIKLEIYRTVSGGTDFFKVREIPVSGISGLVPPLDFIADPFSDSQLVTREPLYISGGVLDRYRAPKAKYVKIINDTAYWGYVEDEDSGDAKPFRIIQGFSGIVDSQDPASYVDLDDEVRGIGEVNGFPIAFTASEIYRLEGAFDNTGGGSIRTRTISESAGCASHKNA